MTDLQKIRFIAANFSSLQGLKTAVIGVFLVYSNVFNDSQIGRENRDLTVPCLLVPVFLGLYFLIHAYYRKTFGQAESAKRFQVKEFLLLLGVLILAWVLYSVDSFERIPVSLGGLFLALALLASQIWMVRQAGGRILEIFPAGLTCIGLMILSAFLPLLGEKAYRAFGFHSGINFAGAAIGILFAAYGLLAHWFLVRSMPPAAEREQSPSIQTK